MKKLIVITIALLGLATNFVQASNTVYGAGTTYSDARYGATVGASGRWAPAYAPAARASATAGFGGNVALSCSGIDFQGFLAQFNPNELLTQMKNTLISGAQAAVSSYLIMLAYSNPTLASVLDMMDKKFVARFDAFAAACNARQARRMGDEIGAKSMAEAEDQCFAQQIGSGTSPTEAYRACANASTFGSLDLPGLKKTTDFINRYTSMNMTNEVATLFNLLPDQQIDKGGLKMRPAQITTMQMFSNLETRSKNAIQAVMDGVDPATIPECGENDLMGKSDANSKCLPANAANIVTSPTFRSAKLLTPQASELYTSAMSSQIATTALYSNIYELKQQVTQMDVKEGSGASAEEVMNRREKLMKSIDSLEREADALKKVQDARNKLAKTQILTIQKAQEELATRARNANETKSGTQFARFIRMFM